jgi:hypothetical protein
MSPVSSGDDLDGVGFDDAIDADDVDVSDDDVDDDDDELCRCLAFCRFFIRMRLLVSTVRPSIC